MVQSLSPFTEETGGAARMEVQAWRGLAASCLVTIGVNLCLERKIILQYNRERGEPGGA